MIMPVDGDRGRIPITQNYADVVRRIQLLRLESSGSGGRITPKQLQRPIVCNSALKKSKKMEKILSMFVFI
jgi:hypothetical protein